MLRLIPCGESGRRRRRLDAKATRAAFTLAIALAAGLSAGCRKAAKSLSLEELSAVPVRVQTVDRKSQLGTEDVVGTVRAKLHAAIEAKVSGRIEKMLVTPGQTVKAGDVLVQLDAREIQARLDQSLALRDQYARDTERLRRLLAENAVSRQEFETAESRYRVAVSLGTEAETMLGYTKILAPFTGIITRKLVDVGDLAAPGRLLVEMEDPAALRLEADVPESLINRVQMGAQFGVRVGADSDWLQATVSEIAPVADSASRTFNVKLDLPANARLRAGQFARVSVPISETTVLRVPVAAVLQRGQMELVFIAANKQAQLRLVKTGKRVGDEVELVSGISAGEQVIIADLGQLRDGQPVEVKP